MYKVNNIKKQETNTNKAKSVLHSIGLKDDSSVRRPSNRDSSFKDNVLSNTKKSSEIVEVSDRTNKETDVASKNVVLNKKFVTDVDVKSVLKAKNVLCVLCAKITAKSIVVDTTPVVSKSMFSVKTTQSKSLDTTLVVSKTKIAVVTPLSAKNKVVQIVLWIVDNGCSKHMTGDRTLLENFIEKFMGTIRFGNDHFAAITGYGDYITILKTNMPYPSRKIRRIRACTHQRPQRNKARIQRRLNTPYSRRVIEFSGKISSVGPYSNESPLRHIPKSWIRRIDTELPKQCK
ncbi:hypothetical protein Tco_0733081 [Tanacetum coccineum]